MIEENLPQFHNKHTSLHSCNPISQKRRALDEAYHVYQYSKDNLAMISLVLNRCIDKLESQDSDLIELIPGHIAACELFPKGILKNINEINLYVLWSGTNPEIFGAYNVTSYIEEESEGIQVHICSNQKAGHIRQAAIVLEIPINYDATLIAHGKSCFTGIIRHELLHLLHKTYSEKISDNVGRAYAYAVAIVTSYRQSGFVDVDDMEQILDKRDISGFDTAVLLANLIYLLDSGEQQAWLQSFETSDKDALRYNKISRVSTSYAHINEYRLYEYLDMALDKFYDILCKPYTRIKPEANEYLIQYFKFAKNITLAEDYDLKVYIEHFWKPSVKRQLEKMRRIHAENLALL